MTTPNHSPASSNARDNVEVRWQISAQTPSAARSNFEKYLGFEGNCGTTDARGGHCHPTEMEHAQSTDGQAACASQGQGIKLFMPDASTITRRSLLGAFAATAITAAPFFPGVTAYARGSGDIRRVKFYSGRTGENINVIYWIDGKYIPESLGEINHFFRDWRNNQVHNIDARTIDFLAAAHNILRVSEPYMLLSGYRSPQTNAMLRARSSGVAQNSLHLVGQAADVRLRSRTVAQIAQAAQSCNAGGVGRYSGSNFVHFDCGANRAWGR